MRQYTDYADETVKSLLATLISRTVTSDEYRQTMRDLGIKLARQIHTKLSPKDEILLVCTNEDADFLARGVLEELNAAGHSCVHLACFWNKRQELALGIDVAPVIRSYIEKSTQVDAFVVVKSIISGGCVVRTNINELIDDYSPRQIMIASPVMYEGAERGLTEDFDKAITDKFEYFYFAKDDAKTLDGNVEPGIGGSVYELLGIGNSRDKNKYTPEIVKTRRATASV